MSELSEKLLLKNFMRFTGPPEHWLTTFNTKFWGLNDENKKFWRENIQVGDIFLFHSTSTKYLQTKPKIPSGIIGIGIVGGKRRKESLEWLEEIKTGKNEWPLVVDFSEIWWFGNYKNINDASIMDKIKLGEQSIIEDLNNLVANCITFEEMTKNHCRIPQMGSVSHINDKTVKENLLPLLLSRLKEPMQGLPHGMGQSELLPIKSEKDIENNAVRKARDLLNFNPNESEEQARERERREIRYWANQEDQERANKLHKKTLDILRKYVSAKGIEPLQSVIDLYIEKNNQIFIFEVKSIHSDNFIYQTRMAIGQLLEYEYFQVKQLPSYSNQNILKGVVYSKKPEGSIIDFLRYNNLYVFWIENEQLTGEVASMKQLNELIEGSYGKERR